MRKRENKQTAYKGWQQDSPTKYMCWIHAPPPVPLQAFPHAELDVVVSCRAQCNSSGPILPETASFSPLYPQALSLKGT